MKSSVRLIALSMAVFGLLLTGCDSSDSEGNPEVTGSYESVLTFPSGTTGNLDVTLREDDGEVSGSGTLSGTGGSAALDIDGTHNHPDISLTFSSSGFRDFNLSGDVSDDGDRISGELNGSDFSGTDVNLTRD